MQTYTLVVPRAPVSQNKRRGEHWSATRRRKQGWMDDLFIVLLENKVPKNIRKAHATAVVRLPANRRRDEGNFRDLLEKALGDALQLQWLPDDTPEHFTFGALTFEQGAAQTTITLEVWE